MCTLYFNARVATSVATLSALLALGACGKTVDTSTEPANTTPSVTTIVPNTAPSVTTTMPETAASNAMGSVSGPTPMMADPTMPASAASAAK